VAPPTDGGLLAPSDGGNDAEAGTDGGPLTYTAKITITTPQESAPGFVKVVHGSDPPKILRHSDTATSDDVWFYNVHAGDTIDVIPVAGPAIGASPGDWEWDSVPNVPAPYQSLDAPGVRAWGNASLHFVVPPMGPQGFFCPTCSNLNGAPATVKFRVNCSTNTQVYTSMTLAVGSGAHHAGQITDPVPGQLYINRHITHDRSFGIATNFTDSGAGSICNAGNISGGSTCTMTHGTSKTVGVNLQCSRPPAGAANQFQACYIGQVALPADHPDPQQKTYGAVGKHYHGWQPLSDYYQCAWNRDYSSGRDSCTVNGYVNTDSNAKIGNPAVPTLNYFLGVMYDAVHDDPWNAFVAAGLGPISAGGFANPSFQGTFGGEASVQATADCNLGQVSTVMWSQPSQHGNNGETFYAHAYPASDGTSQMQTTGKPIMNGGTPNMCLDIPTVGVNGTPYYYEQLQVFTCNGWPNQAWKFQQTGTDPSTGAVIGMIVSDKGFCLEAADVTTMSGQVVWNAECDPNDSRDIWTYNATNDWTNPNQYTLQNRGLCLDANVATGPVGLGTKIQLYTCNGWPNQKWSAPLGFPLQ
jgi:hypothetical protein